MRCWAAVAALAIVALVETRATAQLTTPPLSPPPAPERAREGAFSKFRKLFTWWSPKSKSRGQSGCPECDPLSPVEAAAAKMRREEANARSRIAAVQYLATMPCDHSTEAQGALLAALRGDPHEGVRLEAARALASGCCRTGRVTDALYCAVVGSVVDGYPRESSERVKAMALAALQRCQWAQGAQVQPAVPVRALEPNPVRQVNFQAADAGRSGSPSDDALVRWAQTVGTQAPAGRSGRPAPAATAASAAPAPAAPAPAPGFSASNSARQAPLQYIGQVTAPESSITIPLAPTRR